MQSQQLLIELARVYDFDRANLNLAMPDVRHFARGWLSIDLSSYLATLLKHKITGFGEPYQLSETYYHHDPKNNTIKKCEKRKASKADLLLSGNEVEEQRHYFEFHYLHYEHLVGSKHRQKLYSDVERVRAMRKHLKQTQVTLIVAYWGTVSGLELDYLKPLDNNRNAAFALDSGIAGSSQVSRIMHVQKNGQPRLILMAI